MSCVLRSNVLDWDEEFEKSGSEGLVEYVKIIVYICRADFGSIAGKKHSFFKTCCVFGY